MNLGTSKALQCHRHELNRNFLCNLHNGQANDEKFIYMKCQSKSLLEFQVFQTGFSNQKVPESGRGSKNHYGFLR